MGSVNGWENIYHHIAKEQMYCIIGAKQKGRAERPAKSGALFNHRFLELRHHCLQYPEWVRELLQRGQRKRPYLL